VTEKIDDTSFAKVSSGMSAVLVAAAKARVAIVKQQEFHDAREQWARDNLAPTEDIYDLATGAQAKADEEFKAAVAGLAMQQAACKVAAYNKAEAAKQAEIDFDNARQGKADKVKATYTEKTAFPTEGAVGALCNFPRVGAEEAALPRPPCAEGEPGKPLCCGAAQKFLKDGTKLSIETCQLQTTTVYNYYPPLQDLALVEPAAQVWRFQCISAAQRLAAAAAAALATGYMMA